MFEQRSRRAEGHLGGDRDPRRAEAAANGRRLHPHQSPFSSSVVLVDWRMATPIHCEIFVIAESAGYDDRRGGRLEEAPAEQYPSVQKGGDRPV